MKMRVSAVAMLACGLWIGRPAYAVPIVSLVPDPLDPGTVHVEAQDPSTTEELSSYQISVQAVPEAGATGTLTLNAANGTVPLFTDASGGYLTDGAGTFYVTSDSSNNYPATVTLGSAPLDLFDLQYTASAGATGLFDLDVFTSDTDPLGSALYDENFDTIAGTTFSGTTVAAPEPGSLFLFAAVGSAAVLRRRRTGTVFVPRCSRI